MSHQVFNFKLKFYITSPGPGTRARRDPHQIEGDGCGSRGFTIMWPTVAFVKITVRGPSYCGAPPPEDWRFRTVGTKGMNWRPGGGALANLGRAQLPAFGTQLLTTDLAIAMAAIWIIAAVIAAIALFLTKRKSGKYNYPPSPPGYNILKGGHAYLLPPGLDVCSSGCCNNRLVRKHLNGPENLGICSP